MSLRLFARSTLVLVLLCSLLAACGQPHEFHGTLLEPPDPASDFTLTDHRGQPFTLSEQRGKVQILFFGFTTCPDFCPTTLSDLAAVMRELGDDAKHVQVVMISVDPERDTTERLARYVESFDPSFVGLRPTEQELESVLKAYAASASKYDTDSSAGYLVEHSTYLYVIDQVGRWRQIFSYGTPIADIASDLREWVRIGAS
jgi:protein SCO1/2